MDGNVIFDCLYFIKVLYNRICKYMISMLPKILDNYIKSGENTYFIW